MNGVVFVFKGGGKAQLGLAVLAHAVLFFILVEVIPQRSPGWNVSNLTELSEGLCVQLYGSV